MWCRRVVWLIMSRISSDVWSKWGLDVICERVRVVCDIVPSVFSSVGSSTLPGGRYACMSVSVCCNVCLWFHCCMKRSIRERLREVLY